MRGSPALGFWDPSRTGWGAMQRGGPPPLSRRPKLHFWFRRMRRNLSRKGGLRLSRSESRSLDRCGKFWPRPDTPVLGRKSAPPAATARPPHSTHKSGAQSAHSSSVQNSLGQRFARVPRGRAIRPRPSPSPHPGALITPKTRNVSGRFLKDFRAVSSFARRQSFLGRKASMDRDGV